MLGEGNKNTYSYSKQYKNGVALSSGMRSNLNVTLFNFYFIYFCWFRFDLKEEIWFWLITFSFTPYTFIALFCIAT